MPTEFSISISYRPRSDLLGLWWLGVIPNGSEIGDSFAEVVRRYSELRIHGLIHRREAV